MLDAAFSLYVVCLIVITTGAYYGKSLLGKRRRRAHLSSRIADAAAIPSYRQSHSALQRELSRSRRLERPLSIIVAAPSEALEPSEGDELPWLEFLFCGPIFRDALRELDLTTYDGVHNQFIILIPDSTKTQAMQTVMRLHALIDQRLSKHVSFATAMFPEDGLTLADLNAHAARTITGESARRQHGNVMADEARMTADRP